MKTAEKIMATLCALALLGNLFLVPGTSILFVISGMLLSVFYLYFGFAFFNNIPLKLAIKKIGYDTISRGRVIGAISAGTSLSLTIIGIIFKVQRYPGAVFNVTLGLLSVVAVGAVAFIKYNKSKSPYYAKILTRIAIVGGIIFILNALPSDAVFQFKYRNYPALRAADKNYRANPQDEDLSRILEEEHRKIAEGKEEE